MAITGGFGTTLDLERGTSRQWVIGRDGVKRWADNGEPCDRRCGTCKSWHKRDNYACKFNGPYGGGRDGVEGCKWKPMRVTPNA